MTRSTVFFVAVLLMAACAGVPPSGTPRPSATSRESATSATSPSAAPAATPSAEPASFEDIPPGTQLEGGTYVLNYASIGGAASFPTLAMTFAVPEGWQRVEVDGVVFTDGMRLAFLVVDNVYADPCDPARGLRNPPVGPSVEDLVSALDEVPGWRVARSAEGTFHGYRGTRVEMVGPEDLPCGAEARLFHTLGSPGFSAALENGETNDVRILDVAGTRLVIRAVSSPESKVDDRAELESIVESIEIRP